MIMDKPSVLYMDENLEAEILELLPDSNMEDFSHLARHLFQMGVSAEREHQRPLPQIAQAGVSERPYI
jgi:hypothetical protein